MTSADPRRSMAMLPQHVDDLNRQIRDLTDARWQQASSCAGWQVADLVSHVVRNGWSFLEFVRRGVSGNTEPPFGPHVMPIQEEIKASGPLAAADRQERESREFVELVNGLTDEQLGIITNGHPLGPRRLDWACTQRLVEVGYHTWDLRHSLGDSGPMDHQLASYLLAFMLEPGGRPPIAGPRAPEGAAPQTFRLRSTTDGAAWRVTASSDGLRVESSPDAKAAVELAGEAGWLALAVYGRTPLDAAHFEWSGAPDARARFAAAF